MKHTSPEELKKMGSFVFQRAEALPHIIEGLEKDLEKKPEGKEMVFLRNILEHYIKNRDNFLAEFVSGEHGNRGVDRLIEGLEHPQSEVKPDKKLIKKLKKLAKRMKKVALPDINELHHYELLKQDVARMSTHPDIHDFIRRFNDLLIRAVKYEQAEVAQAIKAESVKKTPYMIRLESFEFALGIWKLLLSRLYWPAIEGKVIPILGAHSDDNTRGIIARKLKIIPDAVQREVTECFPKDKETTNMDNIRAFAQKINTERDKNIFARALIAAGDKKRASMLIELFGKKGAVVVDQKKTILVIGGITKKLNSDTAKDDIELAAKKELHVMIAGMLKRMYESLDDERERFADVISDRIRELEKRNAKILAKLRKMEARMKKVDRGTLMSAAGAGEVAKALVESQKVRHNYYIRTADILKLMRMRILLTQYMMGKITQDEMNVGMIDIMEKKPSKFVTDMIAMVQNLLDLSARQELAVADLKIRLVRIYEYIDKVSAQLPEVTKRMIINDEKAEKLAAEFEDLRNAVEINISNEYRERSEEMKDLQKMGITEETYMHPRGTAEERVA